jgi:hypothetical protein
MTKHKHQYAQIYDYENILINAINAFPNIIYYFFDTLFEIRYHSWNEITTKEFYLMAYLHTHHIFKFLDEGFHFSRQ